MKQIEQDSPAHFICADQCEFGRSTVLISRKIQIVISTVGMMKDHLDDSKYRTIGWDRHYETMVFAAYKCKCGCGLYVCHPSKEVEFFSDWSIGQMHQDEKANRMHERAVEEIRSALKMGTVNFYPRSDDNET